MSGDGHVDPGGPDLTKHPAPGSGPEPVCPRHPGRISYVRCQRCNRPTCPECQRQAAVGVQCVDCVRENARQSRAVRTPFGGRPTDGRPLVTYTIIGLCVLVFGLQQVPSMTITSDLAFVPALAADEPWRFVTAAFLHSPSFLLHIVFNMVALWQVGPALEHLLGRARFVALYLISAVGGSVGYLLLADPTNPFSWYAPVVGASGAVFGLFGATVLVLRKLRLDIRPLVGVIVINAILGFVIQGIAWQAHLGGLVAGSAVTAALVHAPAHRRTVVQVTGILVVAVLVVLAAWLRLASVGVS
ncbi:MAG TPA: rhomboid family intramembrane serine protease [Actinomycetales bacterium]|nr:rhomboid family intramembrane serine protease [Actinomycetales bacterium]